MALTSSAYGTQTAVILTEHSLTQKTGIGVYVFLVNTSAMEADDTMKITIYTKRESADSSFKAYTITYTGVQAEPNKLTWGQV